MKFRKTYCERCQKPYNQRTGRQRFCGHWLEKTGCAYIRLLESCRKHDRKRRQEPGRKLYLKNAFRKWYSKFGTEYMHKYFGYKKRYKTKV